MTSNVPPPPEDPVLRDDELLDAIRRGEPPAADDPVAALLTDWHAELEARAAAVDAAASGSVAGPDRLPTSPETATAAGGGRDDATTADERSDPTRGGRSAAPAMPPAADVVPAARRKRHRPGRAPRRYGRVFAGSALTLLTMTGGLWLGSARAEPGGLLWPVAELIWTERAESLRTEQEIDRTLDQARRDLTAGRYADARAHLERAAALLAALGDDEHRARLRVDLDDLRQRLPTADPPKPAPGAPTTSASTTPPGTPSSPAPTGPHDAGGDTGAPAVVMIPSATEPSVERTQPALPTRPDRPSRPSPHTPEESGPTAPASGGGAPERKPRATPQRVPPTASGGTAPTATDDTNQLPRSGPPPARSGPLPPGHPAAGRAAAARPDGADSLPR
ncbi:hypothetical protein U2F26_22115 [Micromonospora sp. 4G57]|uniref:Anti-sigma-D factor RsdA sigma factor binding region domain-containing protein n=1 Tax=Micromonospora sicca TaxID=2202420 RepID=A0ABU5JF30_9ACTN|nr:MULTISPECIES: hypothetical protein [unclassified Micromonospora]MDZ5445391.1 hypothetical protein [Micromonospora sp. 4G57]MDZ5491200.1 hypothetical protein [Micromonospora sp. 4G53]